MFKEHTMRKPVLIGLIIITAVFAGCASANSGRVKGNGDNTTFERENMPAFEEIRISTQVSSNTNGSDGKIIARIHSGDEHRLNITIDSNLNHYVEVNVINNTLNIKTTTRMPKDFVVDIYSPRISGISIDNAAKVEIIDAIQVPSFSIAIHGAAEIEGAVSCENFFANVYGAGKLTMTGYSSNAEINISGACSFKGRDFETNNAFVGISGAGSATVWAADNLTADISGIGTIKYRGTPNLQFSRSGLGRIRSIN
jgi:hypothetical protein